MLVHYIQQGIISTVQGDEGLHVQGNSGRECTGERESSGYLPVVDADAISEIIEPTGHELESKASAAGWAVVRGGILTAVTEAAAMPLSQICHNCEHSATYRCQQCGPLGYFCEGCFLRSHSSMNIFHVPEKWEVISTMYFCTHTGYYLICLWSYDADSPMQDL